MDYGEYNKLQNRFLMVVDEKLRSTKDAIGFIREHKDIVVKDVAKARKKIAEEFFHLVEFVFDNKRDEFVEKIYSKTDNDLDIFYNLPTDPTWKLANLITVYYGNLLKNHQPDYNPCLTPNLYTVAEKLMKKLEENKAQKVA